MVVSDTTVLISLAKTGFLWVLEKLWPSVIIPAAVRNEVLRGIPGSKEVTEAFGSGWLSVKEVRDQRLARIMQQSILRGRGECECVVLAVEIGAAAILTDDKKARRIAKESGIEVVGTLGLLVHAVSESVLTREEALEAVQKLQETNFRLSKDVIDYAIDLIKGSRMH